jgi:signal recognition particle subunit SRP54
MASRILGMGDIIGLVTQAQQKFDADETAKLQAKMEKGEFSLDDFMAQMGQIKKLGPIGKVMGMIPGMGDLSKQANMNEGDVEKQMGRMRAIYDSMTRQERKKPDLIEHGRRRRISAGAGVVVSDVGQFIKQFESARDVMRALGGAGMMGKLKFMKSLMSGGLNNMGMPGGPMLRTKKSGYMEKKDRNKKKRR